jgi:putative spermidine/putrescine transport system permease protein
MLAGGGLNRIYTWLTVPAVALLVGLFLLPLLNVLWLSVTDPEPGLMNYQALFTNPVIHRIWMNTLRVCLITTVLAVILGYLVAYALAHAEGRARTLMLVCILSTFWLSVLIRAFAWVMLLRTEGVLNSALIGMGMIDEPLRMVRNEFGVIVGMVHYMLPVAIFPMYANMASIPRQFTDAARGLGATAWQRFFSVYLPLCKPGIVSATVLVFVFSLGFYITPAILGGGRLVMITEYIKVGFEDTLRWGYATMLATSLLGLLVLTLALVSRLIDVRKVFGA